MAKGKKTDLATIYKIMISMYSTGNFSETSRILNIPRKTVESVYNRNIEKEEFAKLRQEKTDEFINKASRIINKATDLIEKRIDTATKNQDDLDNLISIIDDADNSIISIQQKKSIARKINKMQLNNLSEVTTALGTLYDKRALAQGKPTANVHTSYEEMLKKVSDADEY